ncbi:MAG TPA: hypothetical protein VFV64_10835 [Permianibacter sp.]|nr:hypothetical protein [Permianibacter sp.]
MNKQRPDDETVTWTPTMPDRRLADRRTGIDRRAVNGRQMTVPDLRSQQDRRGEDRRKVRLTITGRAINAGEPD